MNASPPTMSTPTLSLSPHHKSAARLTDELDQMCAALAIEEAAFESLVDERDALIEAKGTAVAAPGELAAVGQGVANVEQQIQVVVHRLASAKKRLGMLRAQARGVTLRLRHATIMAAEERMREIVAVRRAAVIALVQPWEVENNIEPGIANLCSTSRKYRALFEIQQVPCPSGEPAFGDQHVEVMREHARRALLALDEIKPEPTGRWELDVTVPIC